MTAKTTTNNYARLAIEQISFFGGVIGALILALNLPVSGWAYIPFILSNFASLYLMKNTDTPVVIRNQILFFLVINIVGVVRWLL